MVDFSHLDGKLEGAQKQYREATKTDAERRVDRVMGAVIQRVGYEPDNMRAAVSLLVQDETYLQYQAQYLQQHGIVKRVEAHRRGGYTNDAREQEAYRREELGYSYGQREALERAERDLPHTLEKQRGPDFGMEKRTHQITDPMGIGIEETDALHMAMLQDARTHPPAQRETQPVARNDSPGRG